MRSSVDKVEKYHPGLLINILGTNDDFISSLVMALPFVSKTTIPSGNSPLGGFFRFLKITTGVNGNIYKNFEFSGHQP